MKRRKKHVFMTCVCRTKDLSVGHACTCKIRSIGTRGKKTRTKILSGFDLVEVRIKK